MTYAEKLKDPRWQRKRLRIFERDNWTCQSCHRKDKQLHVHHLIYLRLDPWDYPDHVYQTLCVDCHFTRQELTEKACDAIRMAIQNVPTRRLAKAVHNLFAHALLEIE